MLVQSSSFIATNSASPNGFDAVATYVWDTGTLSWVRATQAGGGGGGAVTIADGADVTQGAIADAAVTTNAAGTLSAKLRGIVAILSSVWDSTNSLLKVSTKFALTASAPTFATVGTSSASAVAANASRKGLTLVNTSANRISLGFGATAVLDRGITLYPGGSFFMDEYSYSTAAINAIASAAASNLAVQEFS